MQSFAPSILIERRSNLKIKARYFPIFAGNRIRVYETVGGKRKAETIYEAVSSRTTARGAELAARDRIKRPFPWGVVDRRTATDRRIVTVSRWYSRPLRRETKARPFHLFFLSFPLSKLALLG